MEDKGLIKPEKIYSVSEITRLIKIELEERFPQVWIEGEVSGFTSAHSGHLYFTIKDEKSQLSAVMWSSLAQKVPFKLENGLQVVCRGSIKVYERRGTYQVQVELIEPKGKGALQLAFEQLKEKLKKEGLFSPEIKKKLPLLPKKVGVVTSPQGAAIIDILQTLERRFARLHILIYPARVQGEGAAEEIAKGIEYFSSCPDIDVIIVGRGGGSMEDLWAFNEEPVARAIFACPLPVISAVGHEVDFTIADFVADIRASTPTAAAELVIEKEQSFIEKINMLEGRIVHYLKYYTQQQVNKVTGLIQHRAFQNFKVRLLSNAQTIDELEMRALNAIKSEQHKVSEGLSRTRFLEERFTNIIKTKLQSLKGAWEKFCAELHNLSPLNILKKGYTLCWKNKGRSIVSSINEVKAGEEMTVTFYQGEFDCRVDRVSTKKNIYDKIKKTSGQGTK